MAMLWYFAVVSAFNLHGWSAKAGAIFDAPKTCPEGSEPDASGRCRQIIT